MYMGQIVCEGEGHLNAQSCLLEGPTQTHRHRTGCSVKLDLPDSATCSLFPGQVCTSLGGYTPPVMGSPRQLTPVAMDTGGCS